MTALNLKTFLPFAKGAKPAKPYFEKHLGVLSKLSKLSIFTKLVNLDSKNSLDS